jgi:hypothetical protein
MSSTASDGEYYCDIFHFGLSGDHTASETVDSTDARVF